MEEKKNEKLKFFLSHKTGDLETAEEIKQLIEDLVGGKDKIDIYLAEKMRSGKKWREDIKNALRESDALIFLYTDPSEKWAWCTYEAGLFSSNKDKEEKIYCLHGDNITRPEIFNDIKCIAANEDNIDEIVNFLKSLLINNDPIRELWWNAAVDEINKTAQKIAQAICRSSVNSSYLYDFISLTVDKNFNNPDQYHNDSFQKIFKTTLVESDENSMRNLFGNNSIEYNKILSNLIWDKIKIHPDNNKWISEIQKFIANQISGGCGSTLNIEFKSNSGKTYESILFRIDKLASGNLKFHFIFNEINKKIEPITSFENLIELLCTFFSTADLTDDIDFIAYTPAIGFLALDESNWQKLKYSMYRQFDNNKKVINNIEIICLDEDDLQKWHSDFEGKYTKNKINTINSDLIDKANKASEEILKHAKYKKRFKIKQMPNFYIFTKSNCAIFVIPLNVPRSSSDIENKEHVDMVGFLTRDANIISNLKDIYNAYNSLS